MISFPAPLGAYFRPMREHPCFFYYFRRKRMEKDPIQRDYSFLPSFCFFHFTDFEICVYQMSTSIIFQPVAAQWIADFPVTGYLQRVYQMSTKGTLQRETGPVLPCFLLFGHQTSQCNRCCTWNPANRWGTRDCGISGLI